MDTQYALDQLEKLFTDKQIESLEKANQKYNPNSMIFKLLKKGQKVHTYTKEYDLPEEQTTIKNRIDNGRDNSKFKLIKEEASNETITLYLYITVQITNTRYQYGIAVIDIRSDSQVTITIFYHNTLYVDSLKKDEILRYFENLLIQEIDKEVNNQNDSNGSIDTYKIIENSIFPLKKDIYMNKEYIHPSLKYHLDKVKEYDIKEYEKYKRSILNNNYQMNKLNRFIPAIVASNFYQENDFPVVGEQPNLAEYTDEYVWFDEKIYLHTLANEYITYGTPDVYMSTSTSFGGNVSIGHISKVQRGKKVAGWSRMSSGDFYITERQLLIFEKGKFFLPNYLLDSDNYKRGVISIPLNDVKMVEGDSETGSLKIYKINDKIHAFGKSNSDRKEIGFSEDELRYMVNLIGSLVEKS